jgi:DtxR family transcriptional regulator, Mn-dependent transcriptional regulator
MSEKTSATIEDYLGILYITERDGDAISGTRLAELLSVSTPTVTNTLKRMTRDGLITMNTNHSPHLTPHGDELARTVMRRHMLAEWMLIRMLSWSKVHLEAHEFEHTISDEVEKALLESLNQPETCPHGNPLPGHEDAVSMWVPLTKLKAGDCVTIRRIHELAEEIPGLLAFLEEKHISPGQQVKVSEVLPFNQTVTLEVQGNPVTLGFSTARQIFVEV